MAKVLIKCPQTSKSVQTGFDMDEQSFKTAILTQNSFKCPICGNIHTWNKDQAFLEQKQ